MLTLDEKKLPAGRHTSQGGSQGPLEFLCLSARGSGLLGVHLQGYGLPVNDSRVVGVDIALPMKSVTMNSTRMSPGMQRQAEFWISI